MTIECWPGRDIPINEIIFAINSKQGGTLLDETPGVEITMVELITAINERTGGTQLECTHEVSIDDIVVAINSKTDI